MYPTAISAVDGGDVTLGVFGVEVVRPAACAFELEAYGGVVFVVAEDQSSGGGCGGCACIPFLCQQQIVQIVENAIAAVAVCFESAQAVAIVLVCGCCAALCDGGKLPVILPC